MSIGKNIAELRKAKGITQAALGELVGVSNQAVSKWESELTMPDVMLLPEIARALGVTLDELYGGEHEKNENEVIAPQENQNENSDQVVILHANSEDEERDDRILIISVEAEGANVKTRMPVEALKTIVKSRDGKMDNAMISGIKTLLSTVDNVSGPLVDVDTEEAKVNIRVENYDNKSN